MIISQCVHTEYPQSPVYKAKLAERGWTDRTPSDSSSDVLSTVFERISVDNWLEDFIFIFYAYLVTSLILNTYLFSHLPIYTYMNYWVLC